jgi:class 3 adenylate cyclase
VLPKTLLAREAALADQADKRGKTERLRRFDVLTQIVTNEETGKDQILMMPDPRRYEWRKVGEEDRLYDKLDNVYFAPEVLQQFTDQIAQVPVTVEDPKIGDEERYMQDRQAPIASMLDGEPTEGEFSNKSQEFLEALAGDQLGFVILSVDIVGSTKLATSSGADAFLHLIVPTFLFELGRIVPLFNGHVLTFAGDGLIAYFPEPGLIFKNDLAIGCALAMKRLVYGVLNDELRKRALPPLEVRFGIDAGDAYVEVIGSPESRRQADIIGGVVSLATKIQSRAEPGGIMIGDVAVRHLHTTWRQLCEEVEPPPDWDYVNGDGDPYRFHRLVHSIP